MEIDPNYQYLYTYDVEDHEEEIDIKFTIPNKFNPKGMKIELSENKDEICISIPEAIPCVCGKLFAQIQGYTTSFSAKSYTISLEKVEHVKWDLLITDPRSNTNDIDPQSAFNLFAINHDKGTPEAKSYAQKMINIAMEAQFLPAILLGIQANVQEGGDQNALFSLLLIAATKYHHPYSCFLLGKLLIESGNDKKAGFQLLMEAAQNGFGLALTPLGQLLSPLSNVDFEVKNAKQALEWFEAVISVAEEPVALYEAAKLYDAGLGCEADHEKALSYHARAKKVEPSIPDLPSPKSGSSILKTVGISLTIGVGFGALASGIYRIIKNRKN
ncbi:hypothetical protein TVAG_408370 [Trichomonas vaginalis G3]|uniref:CS domain-containing protein n=1 Tax=Trichomonas vaginalis (strain ATCC PRA-98 / G3) TaxID=412133 RepID=A2F6N8_TRIV3|nr:tetratricopeptide repeat domain domain-containing protein [Trichomonas vaginalis G3]EAX99427.1 hypothetical protein TVAG_408370 [Trichomonas vaginalis G3]KAI5516138.1 tetratricopeptide repeat domain domain-containing protein [Trichomonas vaginalis G3]|eukprot:XP_001312357.1 hypothetical protein [Trichomonas vaginalis G3]